MFLTMATSIKRVRKLSHLDVKPLNGKDGQAGKDGICGDPGKDGEKGKDGNKGKDGPNLKTIIDKIESLLPKAASNGLDGRNGEDGNAPAHEIDKKRLRVRFKEPDDTWGEWLEIGKELSKLIAQQIGAWSFRGGGSSGNGGTTEELGIWKKCIDTTITVPNGSQIIRGNELCIIGEGNLILEGDAEAVII